jgi:hypothetical protein
MFSDPEVEFMIKKTLRILFETFQDHGENFKLLLCKRNSTLHVLITKLKQFTAAKTMQKTRSLKGQSHEKVYEFFTWDGSFSLN